MATVPAAYADKKAKFPPQFATAKAGARDGAPSHEKPCSNPLKRTARFRLLILWSPSAGETAADKLLAGICSI